MRCVKRLFDARQQRVAQKPRRNGRFHLVRLADIAHLRGADQFDVAVLLNALLTQYLLGAFLELQ
ncbi:hypothetical protein D3C76_967350 [compost metagenome]